MGYTRLDTAAAKYRIWSSEVNHAYANVDPANHANWEGVKIAIRLAAILVIATYFSCNVPEKDAFCCICNACKEKANSYI